MGIKIRSGSTEFITNQDTSGSAASYLYSDAGPGLVVFDPNQKNLKDDVLDAGNSNLAGVGNVFTMGENNGSVNPASIFVRTELPAGCDSDWYVNCEVVMRHMEGSIQNSKNVTLAWAGRLSSGPVIDVTKNTAAAGKWTNQANADYTSNGGNTAANFRNVGWWPLITGSGQNSYPITVPNGVNQYQTTVSRFIKLSDFVNSGESASSFKQGGIIDIVIGREADPSSPLAGNLGIAAVKVRYTAISGSF